MNKKMLIVLQLYCVFSPVAMLNAQKNNHCCCAAAQQAHDDDFDLFNQYVAVADDRGMLNKPIEIKAPTRAGNMFRKVGVGIAIKLLAAKDFIVAKVTGK